MKQLTCEICGGTDLIKQDGAFVCQNCGMKYSVEEAKKMMVEGTVKVDNSDRVKNYYELARTAKAEDDSSTAAKYYALIMEEVPDSWEAKFYSTYYEAMECKVREAYSMCVKLEKNAHSVLTAIKNSEPKEKQAEFVLEIADKMNEIALMFCNGNSEDATEEVPNLLIIWGDQLEDKFIDVPEITDHAATFWENALTVIIDTYGTGDKDIDSKISEYTAKIKKYHKDYVPPKSNLTYHTSSSPNKLSVTVIKVGHETYESVPLIPVPVKVFAKGPDEVGHIGAQIKLKNIAGRTIKYISVYLTPYNSVGDAVCCTVQGHSTYGINITGPIAVGAKWEGQCDGMWYNNTIIGAKIDHVDVTYEDDSIERYTESELSPENYKPTYNATNPVASKTNLTEKTEVQQNTNYNNDNKTSVALILGIIGIIFAWIFALVGHVVSIIGIVLGNKEKNETGKNTGLIVSIIGEVCAIISSLIGMASMM